MIALKGVNVRHEMRLEKGFTLIELIIVIVLLGILAATALPKFADLSSQARTAANRGIAGSLAAAVNIAHAQWIAAGTTPASIPFSGTTLFMNSTAADPGYGFPCSTLAACTSASTPTVGDCAALMPALIQSGPQVIATTCPGGSSPGCYAATSAAATCIYTRSDTAAVVNITYNFQAATVTPAPL